MRNKILALATAVAIGSAATDIPQNRCAVRSDRRSERRATHSLLIAAGLRTRSRPLPTSRRYRNVTCPRHLVISANNDAVGTLA